VSDSLTLRCVATGRKWGDKAPETVKKVSIAGVPCIIREFDTWDGPVEAGESGQYYRWSSIVTDGPARNDYASRLTTDA